MVMAKDEMAIGIRRHFTTPGTDPYDTVEWERREARIPNYKDGTDAFYQPEVEFPVTWSQNATNIVAQKYFRGALGTPERESSLRQVIDRVVDTITAWGERDGYFVDDVEADTFRDELKYVLLHQRAAFNSPVWFNIGVKGVPQQASACQPYHALVSTPEGLVPIGKLVEDNAIGAKVFDATGLTKIVAVKHNGRKEVLRVHTKAGITLDVTADHLVWRASGARSGRFVEAGSLGRGDRLSWHREESWGAGDISTPLMAEAALAGWLQSDGFVGQYEGTNRSLTIESMTVTDAELEWVTWALDEVLPGIHRHETRVATEDETLDCRRTRLYGEGLRAFVERWGLLARDNKMEVPAQLFTAPLPVVAPYLRSLFQAEGYVSLRKRSSVVALGMVSEKLVRGVQQLLMRFGIYARVRFKRDSRPDRQGCWSVQIQTAGDRWRFADEIGFLDPRKAGKLEASFAVPGLADNATKQLEVERVESLGEMDVYDIQTESGEYLSNHLRVHNCFILAVDDTMDAILNWYREEGIIFKGGSGAGINLSGIRSSVEGLQGGGIASGPVSFMRGADASAGTIKSAGKTRRAAKMVILDADHPDIEEFIWCKAREERKARALSEAGFDMDLDGRDSHSIQYQNANNSVRVTDEFMQAVLDDAAWELQAVTTGKPIRTVKARELMRQISEAAWECADPGMQFDTTINRWHTAANTGRINASNPCCFVGDTLVDTSSGPIRFDLLHKMNEAGDELPDAVGFDLTSQFFVPRQIRNVWIAGQTRELVEVQTALGLSFRCTPEHRFLAAHGHYVEAQNLEAGTKLRSVDEFGVDVIDAVVSVVNVLLDEPVAVYDLEVDGTHNFGVTTEGTRARHSAIVHNSEYMHLDNSACNLASINLLKFLGDDDTFDVEGYKHAVEVVFTAQEILVGNADYPTEKIAETSRAFRQLGLGYANLGALLMALGVPYDSPAGRAWAGALTALMTGHAYATSARTAGRMGPFAGYAFNEQPMLNVLRMHRAEAAKIDEELVPPEVLSAAQRAWDEAVESAEVNGVRNSQATVLAPTGCLVGGTLVPTARGLVRLGSLGDPVGEEWQSLGVDVQTDEGPRAATQFYVNGVEPVVNVVTKRGYRLQGTTRHRVKIVDEAGEWVWRHLADISEGDRVPLALAQLVGESQEVRLPPLPEAYWTGEHHAHAPRRMTPELAELVGYFMGDGSLHSGGIRLCVTEGDLDVIDRLEQLGKECFGLSAHVAPSGGDVDVAFHSVRLVEWWGACGFAKRRPSEGHSGKGWLPHIPDAVLYSNDRNVYAAFLRGLFEADGTVTVGIPHWSTSSLEFSHDVQSLLLALGYPTTRKMDRSGWGDAPLAVLRLLNTSYHSRWLDEIGFVSGRKQTRVLSSENRQAARQDHIPVTRAMVDRLAPENDRLRRVLLMEVSRNRVSRRIATELYDRTGDEELGRRLGFFYDTVASAKLGDEELTYDLSVPDNVTYVANGFVSHNTIGLMMDCDTTGIEPDLALTKAKKLVGGGTMLIVNQTVPRALRRLGYSDDQVDAIVEYIDEHKTIIGAPAFDPEHLPVFACSMGDNPIQYMGHITMIGAVQPWISGSVSKTVNMPEEVTVEDVEELHIEAWRLGLKSVAIYRDNCKVAQPLATQKKASADDANPLAQEAETIVKHVIEVEKPVRQKLPRKRTSKTFSFRVADCHGYVTVGEFEDGRPGEIFLKVAKQGSTLGGIMDGFAIAVSLGLQYGVPLRTFVEKFLNVRWEPAGMTDDREIRFATSLLDYIFRRLAVEYLPREEREEIGVLTVDERLQPTLPGVEEATTVNEPAINVLPVEDVRATAVNPPPPSVVAASVEGETVICHVCGDIMQRAGSCHACPSCGATSGCS